ncbi:MAG: hypothetical protein JW717_02225 [Marinilabiliaceae bacterium]|nr:hypothetical protein [Marinilabiliaceae bacterium]
MRILSSLVTIILIVNLLNIRAQEKPNHSYKTYKSPKGELFVNKNQPMYLFIGTSPEITAPKQKLESKSTPQYSNPLYFDTEGYNTIRTPSQVDTITKKVIYPIADIVFEVYADGISPSSKIQFKNTQKHLKEGQYIYNGETKIEIIATDKTSGVENIYVSIDNQPFSIYNEPLSFKQEKNYTLKYYSVDNVGNSEDIKSIEFQIDNTPPVVNWRLEGDVSGNTASGRSKIILVAQDIISGVKTIKYQINDQPEKPYNSGINLALIPSGEYKLRFWAEDNVGNISTKENGLGNEEATVYAFIVDQTPPTASSIIDGDQFAGKYLYVSPRSKCHLMADDDMVEITKITYNFNSTLLNKIFTEPFGFENEKGPQAVYYQSFDLVANKSQIEKIVVYMDNEEPVSGIDYIGPQFFTRDTLFINKETTVNLFSNDAESGVKNITYRIDNGNYTEGSQFKIENSGFHKIDFKATDNVNNVENEKQSVLIVDNDAPEIYVNFSIKPIRQELLNNETINVYPPYVKMYIGATDKYCGTQDIYFTIEGSAKQKYAGLNSPANIEMFKDEKLYSVTIEATDKLKNSSSKTFRFRIAKK